MKRFQLFGRARFAAMQQDQDETTEQKYPSLHILLLPKKILILILQQLDKQTLLTLSTVCSEFYTIVSNDFLYYNVTLYNKLSLLKFNAFIHAEIHTANIMSTKNIQNQNAVSQNARFLVRSITFVDPQSQDSLLKYGHLYNNKNSSTSTIAGAYDYKQITPPLRPSSSCTGDSEDKYYKTVSQFFKDLEKWERKFTEYSYIELLLDIIDYLPNLTSIKLSQLSSNFKIPWWYSVFNDGSRDFYKKIVRGQQSLNRADLRSYQLSSKFLKEYEQKFYTLRRIKSLKLHAKKDQTVHFRSNIICCFGVIDELVLEGMIIDVESLDTPLEFIPLQLHYQNTGFHDLCSPFKILTLESCHIVPGNSILKLFNAYFKNVTKLTLLKITSQYDLLLCNCFSRLSDLTIDCSSKAFIKAKTVNEQYYYNTNQENYTDQEHMIDTETLLDNPNENKLATPPPTTSVVLALNLTYIPRNVPTSIPFRKPARITKQQFDVFSSHNIPPFHYFYHYYRYVWEKLPSHNVNIRIINIPFTNVFPLSPELYLEQLLSYVANNDQETLIGYRAPYSPTAVTQEYIWNDGCRECFDQTLRRQQRLQSYDFDTRDIVDQIDTDVFNNFKNVKFYQDIPNVNFWCFLKSLSRFKSVRIRMLKNRLFCTPRTRYDWELLLKPVLKVNVPLEVRDRNNHLLYSYGKINIL